MHNFFGHGGALSFEGACFYCQQSILGDILLQYKMLDIAYMMAQMAIKNSSSSDDSPLAYATEYGRLVGALQYLTFTRPDITHVVNQVCQHFRSLTTQHLREVKHILWYPKDTLDYGLRFLAQSSFTLSGFCDVDWASRFKT